MGTGIGTRLVIVHDVPSPFKVDFVQQREFGLDDFHYFLIYASHLNGHFLPLDDSTLRVRVTEEEHLLVQIPFLLDDPPQPGSDDRILVKYHLVLNGQPPESSGDGVILSPQILTIFIADESTSSGGLYFGLSGSLSPARV